MTYTVQFGDARTDEVTIAGYFAVQPFVFGSAGEMHRNPDHARIAVQLALTRWDEARYPSATEDIPGGGDLVVKTTAGHAVLTATEVRLRGIASTQASDWAVTTWVLEGTAGSDIEFDPEDEPRTMDPALTADYYPWQGSCVIEGRPDKRLHFSHLAMDFAYGARPELAAVDMLGHANVNRSGSIVAWVLGARNEEPWSPWTVHDESRGSRAQIGGSTPEANEQMNGACGAAYAFNGLPVRCEARMLTNFARGFADRKAGE